MGPLRSRGRESKVGGPVIISDVDSNFSQVKTSREPQKLEHIRGFLTCLLFTECIDLMTSIFRQSVSPWGTR